jgi:hypothetical protein
MPQRETQNKKSLTVLWEAGAKAEAEATKAREQAAANFIVKVS